MADNTQEQLAAVIETISADAALLHAAIHSEASDPDVETEGGDIKPVAKVISEAQAALAASLAAAAVALQASLDAASAALSNSLTYLSPVALTPASGIVSTDGASSRTFDVLLTGDVTLANPTNGLDGLGLKWRIKQDGVGGRVVTLGDKFYLPDWYSFTWSTAAGKTDILTAIYNEATDKWWIVAFNRGY